jgi:hypothetical protein
VTHVISPPLTLPRDLDPDDREALAGAQVALWAECQGLLDQAIAARALDSDLIDRTCRAATTTLRRLGV